MLRLTNTIAPCALLLVAACGQRSVRPAAEVSTVSLGRCADPETSGVVSQSPRPRRADRDLDGDRVDEIVIADQNRCSGENCYWNIFSDDGRSGCHRYLGTLPGTAIEPLATRGDRGFVDVRSWWQLSGGERVLLHLYEYHRGGYRLVEAMVCRQTGDDRLQCAMEGGL